MTVYSKKVCYYCGKKLTKAIRSKEHIPPEMMFTGLENLNFRRVTVPSCPLHNSNKSGQDQAIISGFMQSLDEMLTGRIGNFTPNVRATFESQSKGTLETTKYTVEKRLLIKGMPQLAYIKFPTIDWIRQITAGWVYNATKVFDNSIDWDSTIVHSPNWYPEDADTWTLEQHVKFATEMQKITFVDWESNIRWLDGWSPYPKDVYRFYVSFDSKESFCFKHRFYGSFTWYVVFNCAETTVESIMRKLHN